MEAEIGKDLGWLDAGARMVGVRPAAPANHKASSNVYQLTGCTNAWPGSQFASAGLRVLKYFSFCILNRYDSLVPYQSPTSLNLKCNPFIDRSEREKKGMITPT
jgi:hypothetical protein